MSLLSTPKRFTRATLTLALIAVLAGCGSSTKVSSTAHASGFDPFPSKAPDTCPGAVLDTLGRVVARVYHEGISSERTIVAKRLIERSAPLRRAVEAKDARAAKAAAQALLASGKLTTVRVTSGGRTLAAVGLPSLTPLQGTLKDSKGAVIATYATSVWSDAGFVAESQGVGEGPVALRVGGHSVGGSFAIPDGSLPNEGTLTVQGVSYRYTSFAGEAFPSGALRVYLFKALSYTSVLCGASTEETVFNTLSRIAKLIYKGEGGPRTLPQIHRVQANAALLEAVARRDPTATLAAVKILLHHHIVRLRVFGAGGELLTDLGGPYVLAPVSAPLRLHGSTIGKIVLSIQDDEGYKRLAGRLAGLDVLMYMNVNGRRQLVKNSLGPNPGTVPAGGSYTYRGKRFNVLTIPATAFPSGPLTIRVLIPVPYV
ncbi:MAG: hypothetical protein ACYDHN_15855 [Solirubrobacteraceae bacterium]